jgi:hypothetical protein
VREVEAELGESGACCARVGHRAARARDGRGQRQRDGCRCGRPAGGELCGAAGLRAPGPGRVIGSRFRSCSARALAESPLTRSGPWRGVRSRRRTNRSEPEPEMAALDDGQREDVRLATSVVAGS